MAKIKRSKNRSREKDLDSINAQIVEKLNRKSALEKESEDLTAAITESKARLKEIRLTLRKLDRNIATLESMREKLGTAKRTEQAMAELQPKITALLNSGKSIDEIAEMLGE